jgi:hypothetical protein
LALSVPLRGSRFLVRRGSAFFVRQLDTLMKISRTSAITFGLELMTVLVLLATSVSAKAALRIERAYCGAKDSWCDVTTFLQRKVQGDTLSTKISQPYREIGGDPAPGQVKHLIIDYRLDGASYRLALTEKYPVAFTVEIPSSEATAPGGDPTAAALMSDAKSHIRGGRSWAVYFGYSITIVSIIWAIVATVQLRKVKKQLRTAS